MTDELNSDVGVRVLRLVGEIASEASEHNDQTIEQLVKGVGAAFLAVCTGCGFDAIEVLESIGTIIVGIGKPGPGQN